MLHVTTMLSIGLPALEQLRCQRSHDAGNLALVVGITIPANPQAGSGKDRREPLARAATFPL